MKSNIYTLLLALVFVFCTVRGGAQMKTSYFMEGSVPRYDMNAALTPMHGYVNLPLLPLGAFGVNVNNNFLSIDNFIYPYNGGHVTFLHESVDARKFLKRMPQTAVLNTDMTYNLVGFGLYGKRRDRFWSFAWNIRSVTDIGMPKELFTIMKDLKNGDYNIPDVTVSAMAYSEFAVGFTMPVARTNLVIGGRLKFLVGGAHAEAKFDNVSMSVTPEQVTASFGGSLRGSIFGMDYRDMQPREDGTLDTDDLTDSDRFGIGNGFRSYGAAIDIGAEMKFLDDRLKVSVALNDLGFIYWGGRNSLHADIEDVSYGYKGYNWNEDDWEIIEPDGDAIKLHRTGGSGYAQRLSITMNVGVEYNFFNNLLGLGLLSHTRFSDHITYSELTFAGTVRPADWFTASVSHSLLHNKIGILGFAFNFHPKAVNFFLGVDYIPTRYAEIKTDGSTFKYPLHGKSANVYIGLAFTPGKRSKSKSW